LQPLPTQVFQPELAKMENPETSFEAAFRLANLPRGTSFRAARRDNPRVSRIQAQIQKAALIYEDESLPLAYRHRHGIPTDWDGGMRAFERVQIDRWWKRKHTKEKAPRYKELEALGEG
jgi:hypothetical protein